MVHVRLYLQHVKTPKEKLKKQDNYERSVGKDLEGISMACFKALSLYLLECNKEIHTEPQLEHPARIFQPGASGIRSRGANHETERSWSVTVCI
jgi:hypothetical protein